MNWAYGVTTVPERTNGPLLLTLKTLADAGFHSPHLFIDGGGGNHLSSNYLTTRRDPRVGAWGNWILALQELFIRNPKADWFALFQDDIVILPHVRAYLEAVIQEGASHLPVRAYLNLYTSESNHTTAVQDFLQGADRSKIRGGAPKNSTESGGPCPTGFVPAGVAGRGALALVFRSAAVQFLLSSPKIAEKPLTVSHPTRNIDGYLSDVLTPAGWVEMIHHPSLVQHQGVQTTLWPVRNRPPSPSFPDPDTDARTFLPTYVRVGREISSEGGNGLPKGAVQLGTNVGGKKRG